MHIDSISVAYWASVDPSECVFVHVARNDSLAQHSEPRHLAVLKMHAVASGPHIAEWPSGGAGRAIGRPIEGSMHRVSVSIGERRTQTARDSQWSKDGALVSECIGIAYALIFYSDK